MDSPGNSAACMEQLKQITNDKKNIAEKIFAKEFTIAGDSSSVNARKMSFCNDD